jgi:hypothetical protein
MIVTEENRSYFSFLSQLCKPEIMLQARLSLGVVRWIFPLPGTHMACITCQFKEIQVHLLSSFMRLIHRTHFEGWGRFLIEIVVAMKVS